MKKYIAPILLLIMVFASISIASATDPTIFPTKFQPKSSSTSLLVDSGTYTNTNDAGTVTGKIDYWTYKNSDGSLTCYAKLYQLETKTIKDKKQGIKTTQIWNFYLYGVIYIKDGTDYKDFHIYSFNQDKTFKSDADIHITPAYQGETLYDSYLGSKKFVITALS